MALRNSTLKKWKQQALAVLIAVAALPFLYSGNDDISLLEKAHQRGSLTLLTRNSASSYFIGPEGGTGPEYDIVAAFADYLGIALEVKIAGEFNDLGSLLIRRQGELIAANLTRTPAREKLFNFGPDYAETTTVVVYKRGKK